MVVTHARLPLSRDLASRCRWILSCPGRADRRPTAKHGAARGDSSIRRHVRFPATGYRVQAKLEFESVEAKAIPVLKRNFLVRIPFTDFPPINERSIGAAEITQVERALPELDHRMLTRDGVLWN
jgi:hypothetical protein